MARLRKIYRQGRQLIVCHEGCHYAAPNGTRFTHRDRVPVIPGEVPGTVTILGETWSLEGSYTQTARSGATGHRRKRLKPKGVVTTVSPRKDILGLIRETVPDPSLSALLAQCYINWCRDQTHLTLFGDLKGFSPGDARDLAGLGRRIMDEHGVNTR